MLHWIKRYGAAEIVGLAAALLATFVARRATDSVIIVAYAGAWAESLGYGGTMIVQEFLTASRTAAAVGRTFDARDGGGILTGLAAEFGPAGLLDTFLTRPFFMGAGVRLLGPQLGLVIGKIVADVAFYLPVILVYERQRRKKNTEMTIHR